MCHTWGHHIDSDALLRIVNCRSFGKPDEGKFARAIRRAPEIIGLEAINRGNIDNGTLALLEHREDFVLHAHPHRLQIGVHEFIPGLLLNLRQGHHHGTRDPRIVDGAIQFAEFGHCAIY